MQIPIDIRIGDKEYTCQPGTFQPINFSPAVASRIQALLRLWQVQSRLVSLESSWNSSDEQLEYARAQLNEVYDDFVERYGCIHDNQHLLKFDNVRDRRLSILTQLEVGAEHEKAAIFYGRILNPPPEIYGQLFFDEDLSERLNKALNKCLAERFKVDIDYIADLSGVNAVTAEDVLVESGRLFRDPKIEEGSRTVGTRL